MCLPTIANPPDPLPPLLSELLTMLTPLNQGPLQKTTMENLQALSVNALTPPPSPSYPCPPQDSKVKDPQGLPVHPELPEATLVEPQEPMPPVYFQVSKQSLSLIHCGCDSPSHIRVPPPLLSPTSPTPLSPPCLPWMSPMPLPVLSEPEDKPDKRLKANQLLTLMLSHQKYAEQSISVCPACKKPTQSSHPMACIDCPLTLTLKKHLYPFGIHQCCYPHLPCDESGLTRIFPLFF